MSTEELKELCDALRNTHPSRPMSQQAANELERLQGENDWLRTALRAVQMGEAQSNAEPVAWRYHIKIKDATERYPWQFTTSISHAAKYMKDLTYECERLYTTPPRPEAAAGSRFTLDEIEAAMDRVLERRGLRITRSDASAGLIEAAEWHEEKAKKFRGIKTDSAALITQHHHLAATYFRARTADRSGK